MKNIILIFLFLVPAVLKSQEGNSSLKPYCLDSAQVSRLIEKLYRLELLEVTDSLKQVRLNAKDSIISHQETIISNDDRQIFILTDINASLKLRNIQLEGNQLKWWHYAAGGGLLAATIYFAVKYFSK